ncbi:MAG: IS30 family transposase, partial [Flavobacteriales bacterium]|nr:IS30 family transposase [Flavobacteriales bacterium]
EKVSEELEAAGYFCAPYASWEKGGVENYNGLVRQYYPKSSSFAAIREEDLKLVETELNERPRKILDGLSPSELNQEIAA